MLHADAQIGVRNGQQGNNLPSDQEVVELYKSNNIQRMRLYGPNPKTLEALKGSNIEFALDIPNRDLQRLANGNSTAASCIKVGPRLLSGRQVPDHSRWERGQSTSLLAQYVLLAMSRIYDAIAFAGLEDKIKVLYFKNSLFLP